MVQVCVHVWLLFSLALLLIRTRRLAAFQPHVVKRHTPITPRLSTFLPAVDRKISKKNQAASPKSSAVKRRPSSTSSTIRPSSTEADKVGTNDTVSSAINPASPQLSPLALERYSASKLAELQERNRLGMNLTQSYCDSVLALCVSLNDWDSVWEVIQIMASQGLSSQERNTFKACLQSCFEVGNGESALEIFTAMTTAAADDHTLSPDPVDVGLVVAAMCKQNQREEGWWKRALSLLKSTAADAVTKGGEKLLDESNLVPVEAYDAVLSCFVPTENWKEAARLLHLMERPHSGHPDPTVSTYRLVIETCVQAKQGEQAFQVLMSMSKRGLTPTVYTFELIISALAQKLLWRRALQLLDMMDELQVQKTVIIYNTVISACAKAGEVGSAKNLLLKMRRAGVKPDIFSFNSVMTACARGHRWQDALTILDECHREPGVEPDIITYTNAIRACTKGGKTVRALNILQVVKDKKLPLDNYAYAAAIDACAKGRMWQRALELLDEMEKNGVTPNAITYSVAITACGNGGQWEKALCLLDKMKGKGLQINLITYNSAITALSKASRRGARKSTKEHAPQRFSVLSDKAEVLDIDEQQLWTKALDLLERIKQDGLEPDGFSYSAAISCCGAGGRWKEALALIRTMQSGGPKTRPNKIAYTAAISACGRSGKHAEALRLFTDMKEQGLQPDRVAYNALLSALRVAEMPDQAVLLWQEMIGKQSSPSSKIASAKADPSLSPDIITVTDVLATLVRSGGPSNMNMVDQVFAEAVQRGIVLGKDKILDSHYEIDLSGMAFPVARASVRFIFNRIKDNYLRGGVIEDVILITGIGAQFLRTSTASQPEPLSPDQCETTQSLRDYTQDVLNNDFEPRIKSSVPQLGQGTVLIAKDDVLDWVRSQT